MFDDDFEWDEEKNEINIKKHGISFYEARSVFGDDNALMGKDTNHSDGEERLIIIGMNRESKILFVCHCYRGNGEKIRLISARKANKRETNLYWEEYDHEIY
jgi:hypothetical protein